MKRPRIIPVLLLQKGGLVKSVNFKNEIYIGDPINAVRIYNDLGVDELILLDIDATKENRTISIELIREIGEETNMPFSVGGGIKDLDTIQKVVQAGAERVVLNTYALSNLSFIKQASEAYGTSTIVVCIDYKKNFWGKEQVYTSGGLNKTGLSPLEAARLAEDNGAGEIIIQSIDKDGTMSGFDLEMIDQVNRLSTIPVVGLGGAGQKGDFEELYKKTSVNGIASGSFFVFQSKHKGVLISYPPTNSYNFVD